MHIIILENDKQNPMYAVHVYIGRGNRNIDMWPYLTWNRPINIQTQSKATH